ncbi:hypothetical protein B6D60_07470, partial [candidate division KSB1 bacterium 4484_87]
LEELPDILQEFSISKKNVLITDRRVGELYARTVFSELIDAGFDTTYIEIAEGESSKSISVYESVLRKMVAAGIDRSSAVIALGGGVVGDLAGFVAATYMRGNLPGGKNLVGAFFQPKIVVIDPQVVATLSQREIYAGFGEVVKYALIRDKTFFELLEKTEIAEKDNLDFDLMEKVIARCCEIKSDVVRQDEKETGLRGILNFGHTPGHALEGVTGYSYFRHGEAVVWGMRVMAQLSFAENFISKDKFDRIEKLLQRIPVPPLPKDVNSNQLMQFMKSDKKRRNEKLALVVLEDIGDAKIVSNLPEKNLQSAMEKIFFKGQK